MTGNAEAQRKQNEKKRAKRLASALVRLLCLACRLQPVHRGPFSALRSLPRTGSAVEVPGHWRGCQELCAKRPMDALSAEIFKPGGRGGRCREKEKNLLKKQLVGY